MTDIKRLPNNDRMSAAVIVNGMAWFKGVTPRAEAGDTIAAQTSDVLAQVDALLEKAGTRRDRLVTVNIWLKNIADMAAMNEIYDAWIVPGQQPVRACVEANLARPGYLIEIQVSAAL